jgi:hypothetical protein
MQSASQSLGWLVMLLSYLVTELLTGFVTNVPSCWTVAQRSNPNKVRFIRRTCFKSKSSWAVMPRTVVVGYHFTLKTEAAGSSETLVSYRGTTRRHSSKDPKSYCVVFAHRLLHELHITRVPMRQRTMCSVHMEMRRGQRLQGLLG